MAKKRKESSSQSSTLLDFFGKPAKVNKKPKVVKKSLKPLIKREQSIIDPADIIVIDSDEDDVRAGASGPPVIDIGSSSDVEIVDDSATPSIHQRSRPEFTNPRAISTPQVPAAHCSTSFEPFGVPYLLCDNTTSAAVSTSAASGFGQPSLLMSPSSDLSTLPAELAASGIQTDPIIIPQLDLCSPILDATDRLDTSSTGLLPEDEEWGTGDDEMEFVGAELASDLGEQFLDAQEDEVDIDLTLDDVVTSDSSRKVADDVCPICGAPFASLRGIVSHLSWR